MYRDELEHLGISPIEENSIMQQIKSIVSSPIVLISSAGNAVYNLFGTITKRIQQSKNQALFDFKQKINRILVEYIETDLQASENALQIARARETRLKGMIEKQKEVTKMCDDSLEKQKAQMEAEIFED